MSMKKPASTIAFALILLLMFASSLALPANAKYPQSIDKDGYTEFIGNLDGADFVFRMPEDWNGMLVVGCRGYGAGISVDDAFFFDKTFALTLVGQGYAWAASDFGEEGWCVQKAVIRTHQLTEYIKDNFEVEGKIFLIGASFGGGVALLLGEKYPELFSGVLDLSGVKDAKALYALALQVSGLSIGEIRSLLNIPPIIPDATIQLLKNVCITTEAALTVECGGTLEEKPQAYEKISPVDNAGIKVPVITVHGAKDIRVPLSQATAYQNAVASIGKSDLYRLYVLPTAGHYDAQVIAQALSRLNELVAWSNTLGS
jgi:pimeloyl-ACP methyl ester carboxylesterase